MDGFSSAFFKHFWDLVGTSLVRAIQGFFNGGFLLKEWNQTFLILIPKISTPETVHHLRPISLCNTIYKCLSKCMVVRMKSILPHLISEYQHAFMPGRHLANSVMLCEALTHKVNSRRGGGFCLATLKVDMNKAYDRVRRVFIIKILHSYGFPPFWIHLIKQCLSTVSYTPILNGCVLDNFKPSCGLRQGYPLSPYLFLLCMDVLSRMLLLSADLKLLIWIQLGKQGPRISHLFFADDSMFFFEVSVDSATILADNLARFSRASGQLINLGKSFIKFSGVGHAT